MADKRLTPVARNLRTNATDAEKRLWSRLRASQLGVRFTRQFPIGGYVADFACRRLKLVIELDGGQHADNSADVARTRIIEAHGYTVLRFWNNEVLENSDGVVATIIDHISIARNQTPPP